MSGKPGPGRGKGTFNPNSIRSATWRRIRLAVLDRDGWTCWNCRKPLVGTNATVDHIVPRSAGGTPDMSNLRASCRSCNSAKSMADAGQSALARRAQASAVATTWHCPLHNVEHPVSTQRHSRDW